MPTYEYECLECKHRFEAVHSMSASPVRECEKCGKKVRKVFTSTGIIFKGSGFYVNDYKKKGGDKAAGSSENSKCETCSSSSTCPSSSEG